MWVSKRKGIVGCIGVRRIGRLLRMVGVGERRLEEGDEWQEIYR
jgi:hypothetical protein